MTLAPLVPCHHDDDLAPVDSRNLRRAYILTALAIAAIWALVCCGCSFTLSDVNIGASAGTVFDDPFNWGKRTYQVSISGHYTRDK